MAAVVLVSQVLARVAQGTWAAPMSPGAVAHMGHRPESTGLGGQSPFAGAQFEVAQARHPSPT